MAFEPSIDWERNTGAMIGRFQPWNQGHRAMFEQIARLPYSTQRDPNKTTPRQVVIMVRHQGDGKYKFDEIKQQIIDDLEPEYHGKYTIISVPNITNVFMGRGVGYDVERVNLSEDYEPIDTKQTLAAEREYFWDSALGKTK